MHPLRFIEIRRPPRGPADQFPFSVPAIRELTRLEFPTAVTFLAGENGSGKSTLLEALAAAAKLPTVGASDIERDATLRNQRELASMLTLGWSRRTRRGFFLRAEDFFGFAKRVAQLRAELVKEVSDVAVEWADRSAYARGLRLGPVTASVGALDKKYGANLDANSHGQSFLQLFRERFVPEGLHLLDEPEAALSPQSQLALLAMLKDHTAGGAQFVIATHSPLLLAFPDSTIYSFDEAPVRATAYDDLASVQLTRDFLRDPAQFLRHL